ncbi:MAG: filamentous hemagglutinin N-terminal domain-containing protein, partial [Pseudomonadota bacterium]
MLVIIVGFWSIQAYALDDAALPMGVSVTMGQANITTLNQKLTVQQNSDVAILQWDHFDIGAGATVQFDQPNARSVVLNRIHSHAGTQILGNLTANGQVFLINPNGVLIGKNARVDVGGFVASTLSIGDDDFLSHRYFFSRNKNEGSGSVVNQGDITASYVALLGTIVQNETNIDAVHGTVALAAGNAVILQLEEEQLFGIQVESDALQALVKNNHLGVTDTGRLVLSDTALNTLFSTLIEENTAANAIVVDESGCLNLVWQTGHIVAQSALLQTDSHGIVSVSGTIDVSSDEGVGGLIQVTGQQVMIADGTQLLAQGAQGGGAIDVGSDWEGEGGLFQSTLTLVGDALLDVSACDIGDGGTIVVRSDIQNLDSITVVEAKLLAKGGINGGNGGRIETSGHYLETERARGSAGAYEGVSGIWLFDPFDVTIAHAGTQRGGAFGAGMWTSTATSTILDSNINTLLNAGTNVTIQTGTDSIGSNGSITMDSTAVIAKTVGTGAVTLALNANRSILLAGQIYAGALLEGSTSHGSINLHLNAARSNVTGMVSLNGATIYTQGGDFTAYGGSSGTSYLLGNSDSSSDGDAGFYFSNANLYTSGGNIVVWAANGPTVSGSVGAVDLHAGVISSAAGNIAIRGDASGANFYGLYTFPSDCSSLKSLTISSTTGDVSLIGTSSLASTGPIELDFSKDYSLSITSVSGNVYIGGTYTNTTGSATLNIQAGTTISNTKGNVIVQHFL